MTRQRQSRETHTLQVWPGGQSYNYRGDPDGPENQRSLRAGYYQARVRCTNDCRRTFVDKSQMYVSGGGAVPVSSVYVDPCDDPRAGKHCVGDHVNYPERFSLCSFCKGAGYVDNPIKNPWRKGTKDEWRAIRIELRAEMYWSRDGLGCDSALVDDLLKVGNYGGETDRSDLGRAFEYDEIRNLYADPSDWDAEQCREYASDNGIDLPELPNADGDVVIRALKESTYAAALDADPHSAEGEAWSEYQQAATDDTRHGWLTEARDACRDHAQDNPAEVYEWWRVSEWLCGQLHEIGEVTISNDYGDWWGRTCTGQSLLMDGTLQQVAAQYEREG